MIKIETRVRVRVWEKTETGEKLVKDSLHNNLIVNEGIDSHC